MRNSIKSVGYSRANTLRRKIKEKIAKNKITRANLLHAKRMPKLLGGNQSGIINRKVPPVLKTGLLRLLQTVRKRRNTKSPIKMNTKTLTVARFDPHLGRNAINSTVSVKYANTNNNSILVVRNSCLPTQSWLDAQSAYIKNLDDYDFFTAAAYAVRSHEWIGPWLRTKKISNVKFSRPRGFIMPLYPQVTKILASQPHSLMLHMWVRQFLNSRNKYNFFHDHINEMPIDLLKRALNVYTTDLQRIIRGAPPLPNMVCVFRGIYTDIFRGQIGVQHKMNEFASAAYVPQRNYAPDRYVRMKLIKGTRVLLLQGLNTWKNNGEFEILLNKDSRYIIRKRNLLRHAVNSLSGNSRQVEVTDITVTN
jgi:hypothetical protein